MRQESRCCFRAVGRVGTCRFDHAVLVLPTLGRFRVVLQIVAEILKQLLLKPDDSARALVARLQVGANGLSYDLIQQARGKIDQ